MQTIKLVVCHKRYEARYKVSHVLIRPQTLPPGSQSICPIRTTDPPTLSRSQAAALKKDLEHCVGFPMNIQHREEDDRLYHVLHVVNDYFTPKLKLRTSKSLTNNQASEACL